MINLLPDNHKNEIRAARMNVLLVRYIAILAAAIMVLGGIVVASYVVLNAKKSLAESQAAANKAKTAPYESVRTEAEALRSSLSSAKSILDQKVSYSELIYEIADSMPPGVILETLQLDSTTLSSAMTINASASSFETASGLKDKFASNSEIFSDVKLLSLESSAANTGGNEYPIKVSISVVVNKAALQ